MLNLENETHLRENFRKLLSRELERRKRNNPSYSLRSFAKFLGLDPSLLSKFISGKRSIALHHIISIGKLLGMSESSISALSIKGFSDYSCQKLDLEQFEVISDWRHYALLELIQLDDFVSCPRWASEKLGIELSEVQSCLERLKELGLLRVESEGRWLDLTSGQTTHIIDPNFSSIAHRAHQRDVLSMGIIALDQTSVEKRDQTSMMLTSSPERVQMAKKLIGRFRRDLAEFLESSEKKTDVYQVSISLFPLTKITPGE